uniref:Uncharacterized protein n=1 Tax=Romanomermis culicivorax TaxID=13658 RepID=A0A915IQ77_ROMCU
MLKTYPFGYKLTAVLLHDGQKFFFCVLRFKIFNFVVDNHVVYESHGSQKGSFTDVQHLYFIVVDPVDPMLIA